MDVVGTAVIPVDGDATVSAGRTDVAAGGNTTRHAIAGRGRRIRAERRPGIEADVLGEAEHLGGAGGAHHGVDLELFCEFLFRHAFELDTDHAVALRLHATVTRVLPVAEEEVHGAVPVGAEATAA